MHKFNRKVFRYFNFHKLQDLRSFQTSIKYLKLHKKSNKNKNFLKSKKKLNVGMDLETKNSSNAEAVVSVHNQSDTNTKSTSDCNNSSNLIPTQLSSPKILSYNRTYTDFRCWHDTDLGSEIKDIPIFHEGGRSFTLMSYNILAQDLLEAHPYLYFNHHHRALKWENRLTKLKQEIFALRPHILCLQEVQENHLDVISENLIELEYDHVYKRKTGIRSDGCAIFYNKNIFNLLERHSVEYYQPKVERLNRENVALIIKLCLKSCPTACFIVSTTHLLYNPRRQDVRLAQIQVLLAELDRVSINGFYPNNQPKRLPIILTGDFNLQPYSAPYHLITTGGLYYYNLTYPVLEDPIETSARLIGKEFLPPSLGITDNCQHYDMINNKYQGRSRLNNTETNHESSENAINQKQLPDDCYENNLDLFCSGKLSHSLNLTSVYTHRKLNGKNEATTFQGKWITVDYIFYTKYFSPSVNSIGEGYLKLLSQYALPIVEQCHMMGMIPNHDLGSDHLALAAKFYLQAPKNCKI